MSGFRSTLRRLDPRRPILHLALVLGAGAMALAPLMAEAAPVRHKHAASRPTQMPAAAPASAPAPTTPPRLLVAIAVDQFSADLFAQYRQTWVANGTGGMVRLLRGAVFPSAFQSHAATETCPGHSTILTGDHPARTGIIANNWYDMGQARADKRVYCAEDESDPNSDSKNPVVSARHLKVPTLGERMKQAWPASRNVAVSGKDRAVVMMGGHDIDEGYWWQSRGFGSFNGHALQPSVLAVNEGIVAALRHDAPGYLAPAWCKARERGVKVGATEVGTGHFALAGTGEDDRAAQFRASPRLDAATLDIAARLVADMKLGKGPAPDMLAVSLSETDVVGHAFGTEGVEMCIQMDQLDKALGAFFARLDAMGIDYAVALTADHGGLDLPERLREQGLASATRADRSLTADALGEQVAKELNITQAFKPCSTSDAAAVPSPAHLVCAESAFGDYYVARDLPGDLHDRAIAKLAEVLRGDAHKGQVEKVYTKDQMAAIDMPSGNPQDWTIDQRVRASFDPERTGDVFTVLHRAVVPIVSPGPGYVATHGSPWDYDRRVPLLFWRRGVPGLEQPAPVETVDIAPTLAALIHLDVPAGEFDGHCLDIDGSPANSCGAAR